MFEHDPFADNGNDGVTPEMNMVRGTDGINFNSDEDAALSAYLKEIGL